MVKCSAPMCYNATYNKSPDITFHRFPRDVKLRNAWLANMNVQNWQPLSHSVLCSKHFQSDDIDDSGFRSRLLPGTIPTIFDSPLQEITKMNDNEKVFNSDIVRANTNLNNELYDLIHVVPAKSLPVNIVKSPPCDFRPRCDKHYVPKKKIKLKVKTVRLIREQFESDVYSDLNSELDKQRNVLLRKIRIGSAREEATKKIGKNILSSDFPVSKELWHMAININPEGHAYSAQYVMWNGKHIQINGSKGGKNKFICKYDLGDQNQDTQKSVTKINIISNRKRLIRNSVFVKFRPGPLSKKKYLDCSYQKFQCGNATVVSLPDPALEIQPYYGGPLGPQMATFLNKTFMRNSKGEITKNWADFSVSVLGVNKNGSPIQTDQYSNVTFDLQYKCRQNKILMRNIENIADDIKEENISELHLQESCSSSDINNVMSKILDYVEFNMEQDNLFKTDEDRCTALLPNSCVKANLRSTFKDKCKRKYSELDRLDVTIIKIPESENESLNTCLKSYCALGCICESLQYPYKIKTHCGRVECMFNCQCKSSKALSSIKSLHGLIDLDNRISNENLAKEEQKFRQTIVVSGNGNIVLNSQKRDWKTSKKYGDFFSKMCLKADPKIKKDLCIVVRKLDCNSIEPWCMVHNLYKCFCKGKFTERALPAEKDNQLLEISNVTNEVKPDDFTPNNITNDSFDVKCRLRVRSKQPEDTPKQQPIIIFEDTESQICARVQPYEGRKFSDGYYLETNRKICEMEKNDRSLMKKLLSCVYMASDEQDNLITEKKLPALEFDRPPSSLNELLKNIVQNNIESTSMGSFDDLKMSDMATKRLPSKTKLVAWLEANYKQYKECTDLGLTKTSLDPPKLGKVALYPWEFILSRYRERKNLFLITKQTPYRILMAVSKRNPFFESCININDIVLTDLEKYPVTVKNLLTNATDLKDNFCILCGLSHCWELIGSVAKINERKICENQVTSFKLDSDSLDSDKESISNTSILLDDSPEKCNLKTPQNASGRLKEVSLPNTDLSKWFVMTVENDFSEIHFYKKGFFVKYISVMRAIDVSRRAGKSVKLSSQKFNNIPTIPQFGIYAIPNHSDLNVFIGPYERDEPLGIETIKTELPRNNPRQTRGTWILVNKVDNIKIIDQPLDFLPSTYLKHDMFSLENEFLSVNNDSPEKVEILVTSNKQTEVGKKPEVPRVKIIKAIKVRKANNLSNIIKCYSKPQEPNKLKSLTPDSMKSGNKAIVHVNLPTNIAGNGELIKIYPTSHKPVAEIAPQLKVYPKPKSTDAIIAPSMVILKPDEINKRSLLRPTPDTDDTQEMPEAMEMDIENFLATSSVCTSPNILIISDDEENEQDDTKNVYIQSTNIENLGWIGAKRRSNNDICFEFPGFKCTEFYPENEAFLKLNLVFSRKVYVPKNLELRWEVVDNRSDLQIDKKLKSQDLQSDMVMTKRGLQHKRELMNILKLKKKLAETEPKWDEFVKRRKLLMEVEDVKSATTEDSKKVLDTTVSEKSVQSASLKDISSANEEENSSAFPREEISEKMDVLSDSETE